MPAIVADLGNSRLKLGRVDQDRRLGATVSLPLGDPESWRRGLAELGISSPREASWAISSVNPPLARSLAGFLDQEGVQASCWFDSASQVPMDMDVEGAETGGADRALGVLAARSLAAPGQPVLVVSCGTAVTIESVDDRGVWRGGSIGPGLGVSARALHLMTAQVPIIAIDSQPPPRGRGTVSSLEAGIFWGLVGGVRLLIELQSALLGGVPAVFWTGGDAPLVAPAVAGPTARLTPNLVLQGLALLVPLETNP